MPIRSSRYALSSSDETGVRKTALGSVSVVRVRKNGSITAAVVAAVVACAPPSDGPDASVGGEGIDSAAADGTSGSGEGEEQSPASTTSSDPAESSGADGGSEGGEPDADSGGFSFDLGAPGGEPLCEVVGPIPPPLGALGTLAPPFDELYSAHDLGPIVGIPDPLGGTTVSLADPDVLVVVGASERAEAALYEVPVQRDNCGHIVTFGAAAKRIDVPYADANLLHAPGGLLVSQYPVATLAQDRVGGLHVTELGSLGVNGPLVLSNIGTESPGGLGLVPSWVAAADEFRAVAYPTGQWYRLTHELVDGAVEFTAATPSVVLDHGPGAFAYVPPDSPGFDGPSIIVAEWFFGEYTPGADTASPSNPQDPQRVGVYEVDAEGDPIIETRRDFFEQIERPWGAYFDPVSGDFLFLSWAQNPDRLTQVRGFPPPPAG